MTKLENLPLQTQLSDTDLLYVKRMSAAKQNRRITIANATASETRKGVVELATIAEILAGTDNARAVTPAGLAATTCNVKYFGAVGDDIADDTTSVQNAFDAIRASGGGALYLPYGIFKITSTLTVNLTDPVTGQLQSVEIYGCGGSSKLHYTPADGTDCLYILGNVGGISTLHTHDFSIYGAGSAAATGNGLVLRRCIMPNEIHSVVIKDFGGGAALQLISCWTSNIQIWNYACKYGIKMEDDAIPGPYGSMLNVTIHNSEIQVNSSHGIYGNCNHLIIDTNIIEGNGGAGVYLDQARHAVITNNYFESNTNYHIYLDHSPYTTIRHNDGHDPASVLNVYADVNSGFLISEINEWDHNVVLDNYYIRNWGSAVTGGSGDYHNFEFANTPVYFGADDPNPSVAPSIYGYKVYYTANVNPTTITNFDDGFGCQEIWVYVNDTLTTFDFTGSFLIGNSGVDYAAANGDVIHAIHIQHGGVYYWHCQIIKV